MSRVQPSSVFLVSGGARGITAQCVIAMAQRYQCRFVLMGRTRLDASEPAWAAGHDDEAALKRAAMEDLKQSGEKPTPVVVNKRVRAVSGQREIRSTLEAVAQAGGQAVYVSADITDMDAVRQAAASTQLGPITGLIHGAGNLADKLIEQKTLDDFEYVYAAKVQGLENLLSAVDLARLQHLVLFSSVAGFYGNVGQADYAIANEILNKTAHRLRQTHPHLRVVAIDWGPWEGGMVTPQLRAYFDSLGVKVIPVEVGTQMLMDELDADPAQAAPQVVVGSEIAVPPPENDGPLQSYTINRRLDLAANPFVGDHVVDGKGVLPMVAAMSWMASSAEQTHPGYHYFGFENYKVLKGIVFDSTLAETYTLELKQTERSPERVVVDAMIKSDGPKGLPRFHYSAQLLLLKAIPPAPQFTSEPDPDAQTINTPGQVFYTNGTLFHRSSFQGVQQVVSIGPKGLTMRCRLNPVDRAHQGQFPVQAFNYFMADVGLQSIGIWARHSYDAGSLPLRAMHGEHFLNFDFNEDFLVDMRVLSVSDTDVSAQITLYDDTGRLYFTVRDIAVTMNTRLNDMFLRNTLDSSAVGPGQA